MIAQGIPIGSSRGSELVAHEYAHVTSPSRDPGVVYRKEMEEVGSIGDFYAQSLTDAGLEQEIEFMIAARDRAAPGTIGREVATNNLRVLSDDAKRRGLRSGSLDRDAVRAISIDAATGVQELTAVVRTIVKNKYGLVWQDYNEAFVDRAVDMLGWVTDALRASFHYLDLSTTPGTGGLVAMASTRAHAAQLALAVLRPWFTILQLLDFASLAHVLQNEYVFITLRDQEKPVELTLGELKHFDTGAINRALGPITARITAMGAKIDGLVGDIEDGERVLKWSMRIQGAVELLTSIASLKGMFALRGPPTLRTFPMPMLINIGQGTVAMSNVVISAETIEALRHLIQIGAISAATAAEVLRVRGFTSAMAAQADLPKNVKDYFGEGPTADSMNVANAGRAGVSRPPRHHVMPQEERAFFEERGFRADLDIDNFTVELDTAEHQAQHGGGNWRMGRTWADEWNQAIMRALRDQEAVLGRRLTTSEVLAQVERFMTQRNVPLNFVPYVE